MLPVLELPGLVGWVALVLPLLLVAWILWRDPFGGWRYYRLVVAILIVMAVGGSLVVDVSAGSRSLFLTFLWGISRVTLLFAAISVFSGLHPKRPLSPTPANLTLVVLLAFVLALGVDPLLALIAVLYHIMRLRGPAVSVVASTIATLLGSAMFMGSGPFGAYLQATLSAPRGFQLLWNQKQVWVALVATLILLLVLHYLFTLAWARREKQAYKKPVGFIQAFKLGNLPGYGWVVAGFALLVVAQYLLPDVHDRLAEAFWNKLQGKSYRIREEWWQLIPWREVAYMVIGLATYLLCRPAQKKNNYSYRPILAAAWVMLLLHLAAAPFMTVLFEQKNEWPTLLRVAYELLGWIRTQLPERWMFQLVALSLVAILGLVPAFPALALIAHDGRLSGGDNAKKRGKVVRLTPFGAIRRGAWLFLPPLLGGSIISYFIFG